MDESHYRWLVRLAIGLTVAWVGWTLYDSGLKESAPGSHELAAAVRYLEDGEYQKALNAFASVRRLAPNNNGALRGEAQALMRWGITELRRAEALSQESVSAEQHRVKAKSLLQQALQRYDESIRRERVNSDPTSRKALGVALANRGILKDQLGEYEGALKDYREALALEPEVAEGPGFLTRFMRNQAQRPPTIADRARYIEQELAKPVEQRLMRVPEEDEKQRAYKLD